jgi:hypothetical protein
MRHGMDRFLQLKAAANGPIRLFVTSQEKSLLLT